MREAQIKATSPEATKTIEIETFVKASGIDFALRQVPYCLRPVGNGEKVYALLYEAMLAAGLIGIAHVVKHTKTHLTALTPSDAALVPTTLCRAAELRTMVSLKPLEDPFRVPDGGACRWP